jgi:hypothetical protein
MTPGKKQVELQRYRGLMLATADYIFQREFGSIVSDGIDHMKEIQQHVKEEAEKYFNEGRLDELKKLFRRWIKSIKQSGDLKFISYIKEKTGEELDLFSQLGEAVEKIRTKGKIENEKEFWAVCSQVEIYRQTTTDPEVESILSELLYDYQERKEESENRITYTMIVEKEHLGVVKNVTVQVHSNSRPAVEKEKVIISPDGRLKLRVNQKSQDGIKGYTNVHIHFPGISGAVLVANGLYFDVRAKWTDNKSIIIEIPKEMTVMEKHYTIQSFEDVVTIEYRENG